MTLKLKMGKRSHLNLIKSGYLIVITNRTYNYSLIVFIQIRNIICNNKYDQMIIIRHNFYYTFSSK